MIRRPFLPILLLLIFFRGALNGGPEEKGVVQGVIKGEGEWSLRVCPVSDLVSIPVSLKKDPCREVPVRGGRFRFETEEGFYSLSFSKGGKVSAVIEGALFLKAERFHIEIGDGENIRVDDFTKIAFPSNIRARRDLGCRREDRRGCDMGVLSLGKGDVRWIADSANGEWFPAFSPDGRSIAYIDSIQKGTRLLDRVLLLTPGGEKMEIGKGWFPAWSPEGGILFYERKWKGGSEIISVKVLKEGGNLKKGGVEGVRGTLLPAHDPSPCPGKGGGMIYHVKEEGASARVFHFDGRLNTPLSAPFEHMGHAVCSPWGKKVIFSGGMGTRDCPFSIYGTVSDAGERSCTKMEEVVKSGEFVKWWKEMGIECRKGDMRHLAFPSFCGAENRILFVPYCSRKGGGARREDYGSRLVLWREGGGFLDIAGMVEEIEGGEKRGAEFFAGDCHNPLLSAWYMMKKGDTASISGLEIPFRVKEGSGE